MSIDLYSPEMLEAEQIAKEKFRDVIALKNNLAVEAGSIAIGVAERQRKINRSSAFKFRAGSGFTQWNVAGLALPEELGEESITRFIASKHRSRGPQGIRGWSRELVLDQTKQEPTIVVNEFELSLSNTAYHPHFGRPYVDFIPADISSFDNDPEKLALSYETAAANQLASAKHILNLVHQTREAISV